MPSLRATLLALAALAAMGALSCKNRGFNEGAPSSAGESAGGGRAAARDDDAGAELPLRDFTRLPSPVKEETVVRVTTARVVYADYDLLRRDFADLKEKDDAAIDAWLEANTYLSEAQAKQTDFNSPVAHERTSVRALRPRDYGRAVVVAGLDSKGSGSDAPRYDWEDGDPRTGNMTLGEAIREYLFSRAEAKVLAREASTTRVVGIYAVMSGGFDVIHRNARREEVGRSPAGLLFRQPHTRFEDASAREVADQGKYFLWNQERSLALERVFRRYGLTSEGAGRKEGEVEGGVNIQGTKGDAIVDFGNYVVVERFPERPVHHFYGTRPLLAPGKEFPQPDPAIRFPVDTWGPAREGVVDSKADRPWNYSHELANYVAGRFAAGDRAAAREAADRHYRNMMGTLEAALAR